MCSSDLRPGRARSGTTGEMPVGNVGQLFLSWNVNGLRAALGKGLIEVLKTVNADIVALQEIKAQPEQLPEEIRNLPGYHSFWHAAEKKGYSGTAVLSRREPLRVRYGIDQPEFDREGRILTLEFSDFFFINAYFPNAQEELKRLDYKLAFDYAPNQLVKLDRDLNVLARKPMLGKNLDGFTPGAYIRQGNLLYIATLGGVQPFGNTYNPESCVEIVNLDIYNFLSRIVY